MAFRGWKKKEIKLDSGDHADAICPVIVSVSRATDIPAFFSTWFHNRLNAGYIRWTNPFNANQVQYVSFQDTRVFVFWSKNPKPLMKYLPAIDAKGVNYYFQFTLNDYEDDGLEMNVPPLSERVDTFKELSRKLGKNRVIWRYDPLILTDSLTIDVHLARIARVADMLRGYTEKLVISFADIDNYKKVQHSLARQQIHYKDFTSSLMADFSKRLSLLNQEWGLKIATCAEDVDLSSFGIDHNRCIDDKLMIDLFKEDHALMDFLEYEPQLFPGSDWSYHKDRGQRQECGCIVSKDIGMYNTCHHLCTYCYANTSRVSVEKNFRKHSPESESIIL